MKTAGKNKYKNKTHKYLEKELPNLDRQLKKINKAISFEITYGRYNPLVSSLQTKRENILNKKIKIEEAIKEKSK